MLSENLSQKLPSLNHPLEDYSDPNFLAQCDQQTRLNDSISVLKNFVPTLSADHFNYLSIDNIITKIDACMSEQLDSILHHEKFQDLESAWISLWELACTQTQCSNSKIDILQITKQEASDDFSQAVSLSQSVLHKLIYTDEYDTPGGEPYAAIILNYDFDSSKPDIDLLAQFSYLGAKSHSPILASITPKFFLQDNWDNVLNIDDLDSYMQRAEFLYWNQLRKSESARYLGLVMPKCLARLPYGDENRIKHFVYYEHCENMNKNYLWSSSVYHFAKNLIKSFSSDGWLVNIRGPESGGRVDNLITPKKSRELVSERKTPTEILIPETVEIRFARLGFISMSYYKNSNYGCFFSANSCHEPAQYQDDEANANARINARLPYVFLISRIGHYLKVLQRENIGSSKSASDLQQELNQWLKKYVTKMPYPDEQLIAKYPLQDAYIDVKPLTDNPGYYKINLYVTPHFQIEGINVTLSLVTKMPGKAEKNQYINQI